LASHSGEYMRLSALSVLQWIGLLPDDIVVALRRKEAARDWLNRLSADEITAQSFSAPPRAASDQQLSSLIPALRVLFGVREGGIRIIPAARRSEEPQSTEWPEGEALATPELLYLLRRTYPDRDVSVTACSDLAEDAKWQNCNLIVLGGPQGNTVARRVWPCLVQPYVFVEDGIVDAHGTELCKCRHEGCEITDCALFLRARSPFRPDDRIIVLMAGVRTYGTCAAATYVTSQEWLRLVVPRLMRNRMSSVHALWEVRTSVHDPWPRAGKFLAPLGEVSLRGSCTE